MAAAPQPMAQAPVPHPMPEAHVPDGHTMMLITVPDNMSAGSQMLVQTPSGALFVVTVPASCGPKEQFQIAVPNSAASIGPQSLVPLDADPAGKKKGRSKKDKADRPPRDPSAYNLFMKTEVAKIKREQGELSHREAFRTAAKRWADSEQNPNRGKRVRASAAAGAKPPDASKPGGEDDGEEGGEEAEPDDVEEGEEDAAE